MLPKGWDRRTTVFLAFALLVLIGPKLAHPQVLDLDRDRVPMTELKGLWRFHTGDDPAWSNPGFDDSTWPLITAEKSWSEQGHQGYSGLAWYRLQVVLPARSTPLAFYLSNVEHSCQVFANGQLIGQVGGLPPRQKVVYQPGTVFPIPENALSPGERVLIAIRVWRWSVNTTNPSGGGIFPAPRIGDAPAIADWAQLQQRDLSWQSYQFVLGLVGDALAALTGLGLFALCRREREYMFVGFGHLFWAGYDITLIYGMFRPISHFCFYTLLTCFAGLGFWLELEFYVAFFSLRKNRVYKAGLVFVTLKLLGDLIAMFFGGSSADIPGVLGTAGFYACIVLLLLGAVKARDRGALVLVVPNAGLLVVSVLSLVSDLPFLRSPWVRAINQFMTQAIRWPFPTNAFFLVGDFELVAVLVILVLRFARTRRDEERMAAELEAARTVQQVLIPEEIPSIPGLALECVYKPAGQVGGDFFQILPTPSNGALIVIGDVSGKGMPAAMAVSLLVGTVRTLAHYTQSPAEILTAMNQRMLGRSKDGFTTSLVLRIDPDGSATVANAGHLAPYRGSEELPVEAGLPLGLAQAAYTESTFHLDTGEELTLVTDGVAEARAKNGELFGFDRTASIAILSAQHIAATAAAFGQQDDITVLKIRRHSAAESRPIQPTVPTLSPSIA